MKTQLKETLLSARDNGSAETEIKHNGFQIKISVTSEAEAITVALQAPRPQLQEDIIIEILGILGHPPDVVYNVRGAETKTMEAVWAHPGKDFKDELRPVLPRILAAEHRILMVSDRLYQYLVPNHPDDWDKNQVGAWEEFWNLRLRDATFREWILKHTDPRVWDYFKVIAQSVNGEIIKAHAELGDTSPAVQDRMENLFVSAAVSGLQLCYLYRRQQNRALMSTVGKVDPKQMTERVLATLSWENLPKGWAKVVNEINITDIRESGELFVQAVTMPPDVLNTMLSLANKCSVLGFTAGETVQGATKPN